MLLPRNVRIADQVLVQEIEGESILLNLVNEQYFGLDEVGTRIWQLLSDNGETEDVLAKLRNEYDVDADTLRKDLASLISELDQRGLIVINN